LEGDIVSLHKYQSDIHKVKPAKEDTVLGTISGRWTQKVYFNS
jgi:tRNA(Ser,Leu) C12 N-acetylase TAN1